MSGTQSGGDAGEEGQPCVGALEKCQQGLWDSARDMIRQTSLATSGETPRETGEPQPQDIGDMGNLVQTTNRKAGAV